MSWLRFVILALALALALGCSGKKEPAQGSRAGQTDGVVEPAANGEPAPGETPGQAGDKAVDERTGLIRAEGYDVVAATCTSCHSGRLVAQNRGTRRDWDERLRWMQANHNLWELPAETRARVLDYLAANYGVDDDQLRHRRRRPLPAHLMPPTRAQLAQPKSGQVRPKLGK